MGNVNLSSVTNIASTSDPYTFADDVKLSLGTGGTAAIQYQTDDANANCLAIILPAGGATDVPVLVIGDTSVEKDLTLFNGVTDPQIAIMSSDEAVNLRLIASAPPTIMGSSYLRIGDAGTTSQSLAANDDLFVSGKLEVDGSVYLDGTLNTYGTISVRGANGIMFQGSYPLVAYSSDNAYLPLKARDNGVDVVEIARLQGAADPFFHLGLGSGTVLYGVGIRTVAVTMDHATHAAMNAAATTDTALCWEQPAGSTLLGVRVVLTEQFVAASLTDLDFSLGDASGGDDDGLIAPGAHNLVSDAVATQYKTRGALWDTAAEGSFFYQHAAKEWHLFMSATGANLNTLTAGTLTAYFSYLDLP